MTYIPRSIDAQVVKAAKFFPAVLVTGARQSGKTTTLRHLFPDVRYVPLDDPIVRERASRDPELLLRQYPDPVILDEIQEVPALLNYLKIHIDCGRHRAGRFFLTGSQVFPLMRGVSQSLAGRVAVLELMPLGLAERPNLPFSPEGLMASVIRGGFPQLAAQPDQDASTWYSAYLRTYLERDVRALRDIPDLLEFQRFMQMLASRASQLLDLADIGRDLGISGHTVKSWIQVLEASHQAIRLIPYFRNRGKRLVKTPKLYFHDTGLLCHLIGLRDVDHALRGPMAGALMETIALGEIYRAFVYSSTLPAVYFWRTKTKEEVDFVIERGGTLIPIEVKLAKSVKPSMAAVLDRFCELYPEAPKGYLVSLSDEAFALTRRVDCLPLAEFCRRLPSWMANS